MNKGAAFKKAEKWEEEDASRSGHATLHVSFIKSRDKKNKKKKKAQTGRGTSVLRKRCRPKTTRSISGGV